MTSLLLHPTFTAETVIMKKLLVLFLLCAGTLSLMAQLKKITATSTNVSKSRLDSSLLPGQQADLRKLTGKDLKITLISIDKNNSNYAIGVAGIYTINFEMINSGGEDINITGVVIQTYLNTASGGTSPVGGFTLKAGVANFPANGVLHPGEKFYGSYLKSGFNPTDNHGNKFVIKIDNGNIIAETNETNNTLEIPVTGNLESWSTPLPDLTFQVNSIAPVTGSAYLNTSLDVSLVNTGAGEIPADIVNKIIPMVRVYPLGNPGANLYNEAYNLGPRVVGNQTYPGYNTANAPLKPGGTIRLGGSVHINGLTSGASVVFHFTIGTFNNEVIPDANAANNTVDFSYAVK